MTPVSRNNPLLAGEPQSPSRRVGGSSARVSEFTATVAGVLTLKGKL
jgi:hypothetical protein